MNERQDTKMYAARTIRFQHNQTSSEDELRSQLKKLFVTNTITIQIISLWTRMINNTRIDNLINADKDLKKDERRTRKIEKRKTIRTSSHDSIKYIVSISELAAIVLTYSITNASIEWSKNFEMNLVEKSEKSIRKTHFFEQAISNRKIPFSE